MSLIHASSEIFSRSLFGTLFSFIHDTKAKACGSLDIYGIVKALHKGGFDGYMRPDHGRMIWGEKGRYGYGLYDRALGAMYLSGLWEAIDKQSNS